MIGAISFILQGAYRANGERFEEVFQRLAGDPFPDAWK